MALRQTFPLLFLLVPGFISDFIGIKSYNTSKLWNLSLKWAYNNNFIKILCGSFCHLGTYGSQVSSCCWTVSTQWLLWFPGNRTSKRLMCLKGCEARLLLLAISKVSRTKENIYLFLKLKVVMHPDETEF